MLIQCKTSGCIGYVDYEPEHVQLSLLQTALTDENIDFFQPVEHPQFAKAVVSVVRAKNKFNSTKTIYLTCDNTATPHTNAYQVPAK